MEALKTENANLKRRITQLEKQPQPVAAPKVVTVEKPNPSYIKALRLIQSIAAKELSADDLPTIKPTVLDAATYKIPTDNKPIANRSRSRLQLHPSPHSLTI